MTLPDRLPDIFVKKIRAVYEDARIVPTCTPAWKEAARTYLVEGDFRATGCIDDWERVARAFAEEAAQLRHLIQPYNPEPVSTAFELSYSNYLVVPRSLLEAMPVEWQARFVAIMDEFEKAFPGYTACYTVERHHPRYEGWSPCALEDELGEDYEVPTVPDPLANYRHPDHQEIERMRHADKPDRT